MHRRGDLRREETWDDTDSASDSGRSLCDSFRGTPAAGLCQQGLECKQNTSSLFPPGSDTWGRPWARAHLEDDCFRRRLLLWSMTSSVGCLGGGWRDLLQSLYVSKCSWGRRPGAGKSWSAGAKPPSHYSESDLTKCLGGVRFSSSDINVTHCTTEGETSLTGSDYSSLSPGAPSLRKLWLSAWKTAVPLEFRPVSHDSSGSTVINSNPVQQVDSPQGLKKVPHVWACFINIRSQCYSSSFLK